MCVAHITHYVQNHCIFLIKEHLYACEFSLELLKYGIYLKVPWTSEILMVGGSYTWEGKVHYY